MSEAQALLEIANSIREFVCAVGIIALVLFLFFDFLVIILLNGVNK